MTDHEHCPHIHPTGASALLVSAVLSEQIELDTSGITQQAIITCLNSAASRLMCSPMNLLDCAVAEATLSCACNLLVADVDSPAALVLQRITHPIALHVAEHYRAQVADAISSRRSGKTLDNAGFYEHRLSTAQGMAQEIVVAMTQLASGVETNDEHSAALVAWVRSDLYDEGKSISQAVESALAGVPAP